ncbi:MAG: paraquat-inducible protein A [Saprospiraceae bacterium]|jgi:paraquat-inducible protein A
MHIRNIIAAILLIISLICLVPGLMQPILSLKIGAALPLVGTITLHESTQSILKTIQTLNENNNALVAFLILLFSIIVPLFKAISLLSVLLIKKLRNHSRLHKFIALISKWSMADVFVVGIFIAFLSTQSNEALEAKLGTGFYWFLAYCLISIVASQVMTTKKV